MAHPRGPVGRVARGLVGPGGPLGPRGIAVAFALSGVVHLVRPAVFTPLVPRVLPAPRALVLVSGAAELLCAAGLLTGARWAADASTALLLAVWPANVVMALDAGSGRHPGPADSRLVAWVRVPLQPLLIWSARRSDPSPPVRRSAPRPGTVGAGW